MKNIQNEEQYQNSLAWLVEKAKLLEHPLLEGAERDKLEKQFDFVAQKIREYRLAELAGLLPWQNKSKSKENPKDKQGNKSINLSNWLDEED